REKKCPRSIPAGNRFYRGELPMPTPASERPMVPAESPEKEEFGDDDWFIRRMAPVQSRLYPYIASLVPSRADAEDLFQKTWLTDWQQRRVFNPQCDFFAWVCGIARNHVRHFYRSQQRSRLVFDAELVEQLAQCMTDHDDYLRRRQEALTRCLDKLSLKQKQ